MKLFRKVKLIDDSAYNIIYNEIGTAQLRFNFYACFTYLRFLETDQPRLLQVLEAQNIKSIFIFGNRDRSFPPKIGKRFISRLKNAEVVILNEGHEMIKRNFANSLTNLLT